MNYEVGIKIPPRVRRNTKELTLFITGHVRNWDNRVLEVYIWDKWYNTPMIELHHPIINTENDLNTTLQNISQTKYFTNSHNTNNRKLNGLERARKEYDYNGSLLKLLSTSIWRGVQQLLVKKSTWKQLDLPRWGSESVIYLLKRSFKWYIDVNIRKR